MKIKVRNIVFDVDDTLTQTSPYFAERIMEKAKRDGKDDLIEAYQRHIKVEGQLTFKHPDMGPYIHAELGDPSYMLNVKPTRLFDRLFKSKEMRGLIHKKNLSIATHRGFQEHGEKYTRQWLRERNTEKYFTDIHCLDSKEHPDKVAYLKTIYGDDFVLIDDNPFHDLTKVYWEDKHIIIYNEYGNYPAYRNQNFLIF